MIYSLILVGILFLFVGFTAWNVPSFDMSLALSGLLGIYLVICSYAAIGLFMSCLTSYQVVAAVATLGALAFLNYVGRIGQEVSFYSGHHVLAVNFRAFRRVNQRFDQQ